MSHVLELLNSKDLFSPERAKRFARFSDVKDLGKLTEQLTEAVAKDEELAAGTEPDRLTFYRFMASVGIRGDLCEQPQCRATKAQLLARYASLYTDQILVPLWHEPFWDKNEQSRRTVLEGALLVAWELRPVVDAGFGFFVRHDLCYCKDCLSRLVPNHRDILKLAVKRGESTVENFSFLYGDENGRRSLTLYGPKGYYEHHGRVLSWENDAPSWTEELRVSPGKKLRLNPEFVRKHDLISHVFDSIAEDVTLQQFLASTLKCKYLANFPAEAQFLSGLSGRTGEVKLDTVAQLAHRLPILRELPITTLLRLRADEGDAFLLYRAALEKAASESFGTHSTISQQDADELYNSILCPELIRLRAKLKAAQRQKGAAALLKTGVTAAVTVAVGAFSGLLPVKLAEWAGTVAGINVVRDVIETAFSVQTTDPEVRNHDFYFLLRASEEL